MAATEQAAGAVAGAGVSEAWLPRVAPVPLLVAISAAALALVVLSAWWASQGPWLGLEFSAAEQGLRVDRVRTGSPAAELLAAGDIVVALRGDGGPWLELAAYQPALEPHTLPHYSDYRAYMSHVAEVWERLGASPLELRLSNGRELALRPYRERPLEALSPAFWLFHLFGLVALLVSCGVWAFRRGQITTRLFALSGVGFFLATWSNSIYLGRELALDPQWFALLSRGNHLALYLMMAALLGLVLHFPRPLFRWPVLPVLMAATLLLLVNENLEAVGWPLHDFYFPVAGTYLLGAAGAIWQWRRARHRPLDRAALKWLFLSMFISTGMSLAVYFVPALYHTPALISQTTMVGFAMTLYLGLALGILRYRLFDLERWWFGAWLWFFGGVAVLLVDAAVAFLFGLQPVKALGLSVIAVGWLYFPVRQWLWGNFAASAQVRLEDYLPTLVGGLLGARSRDDIAAVWERVLQRVFSPLDMRRIGAPAEPRLAENGAQLQVPVPGADHGLELAYAQRGARLFSRRDQDLVAAMLSVTEQAEQARRAREEGAQEERRRIMRDLHDDVGARILTLIHTASDRRQEELARVALHALRETIYALDDDMRADLADSLADWELEVEERLQEVGARLEWQASSLPQGLMLTPRQAINLKRILHEAVSNALHHARPRRLAVEVGLDPGRLRLRLYNDGVEEPARRDQLPGRGLHNMANRARELGGELSCGAVAGDGYEVYLTCPLGSKGHV